LFGAGIHPPIAINDRMWMDGGMRSGTNVDVAAGHKRVLAVVVIPMAMADARMKARVNAEGDAVTKAGGRYDSSRRMRRRRKRSGRTSWMERGACN